MTSPNVRRAIPRSSVPTAAERHSLFVERRAIIEAGWIRLLPPSGCPAKAEREAIHELLRDFDCLLIGTIYIEGGVEMVIAPGR